MVVIHSSGASLRLSSNRSVVSTWLNEMAPGGSGSDLGVCFLNGHMAFLMESNVLDQRRAAHASEIALIRIAFSASSGGINDSYHNLHQGLVSRALVYSNTGDLRTVASIASVS